MSECHQQFYVWDNVAVGLHTEEGQVLTFDPDRLRENLTFCEKGNGIISHNYDRFEEAEVNVRRLWPDYPGPLQTSQ